MQTIFLPTPGAQQGEHRSRRRRPRPRCKQQRGLEGLLDGTAPGNPPRITEEARRTFMEGKLSLRAAAAAAAAAAHTWNATPSLPRLFLGESFGVSGGHTPEAVRQHLHSMGYSCKRTRYVPSKPPDPMRNARSCPRVGGSQKRARKKGEIILKYLAMRAACVCACPPDLHLDTEGGTHGPPAPTDRPGEEPMGICRTNQPHIGGTLCLWKGKLSGWSSTP